MSSFELEFGLFKSYTANRVNREVTYSYKHHILCQKLFSEPQLNTYKKTETTIIPSDEVV